jgi:ribonuclease BN (tRNA processing enzyme)
MCLASDVLRAAASIGESTGTQPSYAAKSQPRRAPLTSSATQRLILLGTGGGSNPKNTRSGYANAVVVGEAAYLIDCGEGVHRQAWRSGISMHSQRRPPGGSTIQSIAFTHLHSDHVIDYANLLMGFWPDRDIDVYGPGPAGLPIATYPADATFVPVFPENPTPGIAAMTDYLFRALAYNINVRMADEGRENFISKVRVHEIGVRREGYVPDIDMGVLASGMTPATAAPNMNPVVIRPTDANGVTISAVLVQHAPVFPAFGFRIDTPSGSVAFSGDTGPCENVVQLARGADVLVHEVIDVSVIADRVAKMPNAEAIVAHLTSSHSSPEAAGRAATAAGVKTLVLSHLVPGDDEIPGEEWEARARPFFDGEIVCGVDLDQFPLGD